MRNLSARLAALEQAARNRRERRTKPSWWSRGDANADPRDRQPLSDEEYGQWRRERIAAGKDPNTPPRWFLDTCGAT